MHKFIVSVLYICYVFYRYIYIIKIANINLYRNICLTILGVYFNIACNNLKLQSYLLLEANKQVILDANIKRFIPDQSYINQSLDYVQIPIIYLYSIIQQKTLFNLLIQSQVNTITRFVLGWLPKGFLQTLPFYPYVKLNSSLRN